MTLKLVVFRGVSPVNCSHFSLLQNRFILSCENSSKRAKMWSTGLSLPSVKAYPLQVHMWQRPRCDGVNLVHNLKRKTKRLSLQMIFPPKHRLKSGFPLFSPDCENMLFFRALQARSYWHILESTDISLNPSVKIITSATGRLQLGMHVKSSSRSGIKENSHPKHCLVKTFLVLIGWLTTERNVTPNDH